MPVSLQYDRNSYAKRDRQELHLTSLESGN